MDREGEHSQSLGTELLARIDELATVTPTERRWMALTMMTRPIASVPRRITPSASENCGLLPGHDVA